MSSVWSLGGWRHSMFGNSCCDCFGNSKDTSDISDASVHRRHHRTIIIICSFVHLQPKIPFSVFICRHFAFMNLNKLSVTWFPQKRMRNMMENTLLRLRHHMHSFDPFHLDTETVSARPMVTDAGSTRGERGVRTSMFWTKMGIENDPWAPYTDQSSQSDEILLFLHPMSGRRAACTPPTPTVICDI